MSGDIETRTDNRVPGLIAASPAGLPVRVYANPSTHALKVESSSSPSSSITDGRKTVTSGGTRETLVAVSTPCSEVTIMALYTNGDAVVVGGSTVVANPATRSGIPLFPGGSITIRIDDAQKIYLDVVTNGDGVSFIISS